jgi:hypothetical protein
MCRDHGLQRDERLQSKRAQGIGAGGLAFSWWVRDVLCAAIVLPKTKSPEQSGNQPMNCETVQSGTIGLGLTGAAERGPTSG